MTFTIENKEKYFEHLSSLPIAIVVADLAEGTILYMNPTAEEIWMKKAEDLIGHPQSILHPAYKIESSKEEFHEDADTLEKENFVTHSKNIILRSDGHEMPVELSVSRIHIEGKEALVESFVCIEKREVAYRNLQSREEEMSAIFENSQIGIMYLQDGRFLHRSNQRLADILGYDSPQEMQGISMQALHLSTERFEWFGKHHYVSLRNHESTHINYQLRKKNGESIWISLSGKSVDTKTPADLDKGVIWIIDDISDYKKLEHTLTSHNKRLQNLLNNIKGISWEFDLVSDRFTYVSSNAEELLGYKHSKWVDFDSWKEMIHPQDREEITDYCTVERKKAKEHTMEYRMLKKNGSTVWVLEIISVGVDADGEPVILYGFILDITKQKINSLQIEHDKKYLQNIVNSVPDPIMVIREDYSVDLMNTTLQKKLPSLTLVDKENPKCYEISHSRSTPCDGIEHPCPLAQVMQTKENTKVLHKHKDSDGLSSYIELAASPLLNKKGDCIGIIESARDVTKHLDTLNALKEKSTELDHQAHHDALTGLPNRTLYHDRVDQAIEKAKRLHKKFMLFFIDLDHFKEVNDSLGHDAGDKVLLEASKRFKSCIRAEDTLARLGGDEFTVLLENINRVQDVSPVAQKIIDTFREPFVINGHQIYLSCSIGISSYPNDSRDAIDLLKFADNAMYKAKNEGRDNFQFYSKEMTELAFERMVMESNIRQAIANNEFRVYYQPQYNARAGMMIGMEALIRWEHPTLGLVPPSKFIPLAEESSLIIEIDNWVMQNAMKQVSAWYKEGLNPGVLSLNLAIKQLESPTFIERLEVYMSEAGFRAEWLKLEVLERDVMQKPQENVKKLQTLHNLGVKLAIDDFGTGQSSLTYLKRFPLDQLKIDQSFVQDIHQDEEDDAIVTTIIALAKALKLDVIAEGVETKEQLDFLLENGCDNIQGYYFCHPADASSTEKLLHN